MVAAVVKDNPENQTKVVAAQGGHVLIRMVKMRNREISLPAIDALYVLVENNKEVQATIKEAGAVEPLLRLIRKSRVAKVQLFCGRTLWALAGTEIEERQYVANELGLPLIVDLLSQQVYDQLHFIASEALGVLAQGSKDRQQQIAKYPVSTPLVQMLKSDNEERVLSAIRCIRYLCLSVGFVVNADNQDSVLRQRVDRYLVVLMNHSVHPGIQAEAAFTLAALTISNHSLFASLLTETNFSYLHVLKMLYDYPKEFRVLAGDSLATFAYNNVAQQNVIAVNGGVRYRAFAELMDDPSEEVKLSAAFQLVILCKVVPDVPHAASCAKALRLIVDILDKSGAVKVQALACDVIARLCHTRSGIPQAFVVIDVVKLLCKYLVSDNINVQANAAVALGYLSYDHGARSDLLQLCRHDPDLVQVIFTFTKRGKISRKFLEQWHHQQQVGLPPLSDRRYLADPGKRAIRFEDMATFDDTAQRPFTVLSFAESVVEQKSKVVKLPILPDSSTNTTKKQKPNESANEDGNIRMTPRTTRTFSETDTPSVISPKLPDMSSFSRTSHVVPSNA